MCQGCLDVVKKHYGHLPESEWGELLISATCYPFGGPEQIEPQLVAMREAGCNTLSECRAFAQRLMDRYMDEIEADDRCEHGIPPGTECSKCAKELR